MSQWKPFPKTNAEAKKYYATASNAAYKKNPVGYMKSKGYNVEKIDKYTNKNWVTFQDPQSKEVTVSFRGTKPTNWNDLKADLLVATGLENLSGRFKSAENMLKSVVSEYGRNKVTTTGHSLGGSLSLYTSKKTKVENYAFNPGVTKPSMISKGTHINLVAGDPISNSLLITNGTSSQKVNIQLPKQANPHTINEFIP